VSQVTLLKDNWSSSLCRLIQSAQAEIVISSPFVTQDGISFIAANSDAAFLSSGKLIFLTNLSPVNLIQGATDPNALHELMARIPATRLYHLPRLHAKVYVSDSREAIITSGNLTLGGLSKNYEYGVLISERGVAAQTRSDIVSYAELGAPVSEPQLLAYCAAADQAKAAFQKQQASASQKAQRAFRDAFQAADDELIRLRLAEGPMHAVFVKTIMFLLEKHGPLSTEQLHPLIEQIHPDLCDNTVDRVIDGKSFGKKWKHAVRTAQQHLKKQQLIALVGDKWQLV